MPKIPVPKFEIGSTVYHLTNPDEKGMVTGYSVRHFGISHYYVVWSDGDEKDHMEIELSEEKRFSD